MEISRAYGTPLTESFDIICPEGKARTVRYVQGAPGRFLFQASPTGEDRVLAGSHFVAKRLGLPPWGPLAEMPDLETALAPFRRWQRGRTYAPPGSPDTIIDDLSAEWRAHVDHFYREYLREKAS